VFHVVTLSGRLGYDKAQPVVQTLGGIDHEHPKTKRLPCRSGPLNQVLYELGADAAALECRGDVQPVEMDMRRLLVNP
jgi:hypothetical protein